MVGIPGKVLVGVGAALVVGALALLSCGARRGGAAGCAAGCAGARGEAPVAAVAPGDAVVLAAGDIASCASSGDEATATLLDSLAGTVIALGDNVYQSGTALEFTNCYGPSWGRHLARTMPAAGNHEYNTPGASGYYGYFGAAAGDPAKGYYSYDLDAWHIVVVNSNCVPIGGCGAGSPEEVWLRADLTAHPAVCTMAYWHHPRFSSGSSHGETPGMQPIWQALQDAHADVVLSGHEHNYERFAPQTAEGAGDPYGIVEFVVGTGGRSHFALGAPHANSLVRNSDTYGVLKLTLHATSYDWEFVPEAGKTFTDAGTADCQSQAVSVGGVAEQPDVAASPAVGASSGGEYARYALGAGVAAIVAAVGAAGWRRWRAAAASRRARASAWRWASGSRAARAACAWAWRWRARPASSRYRRRPGSG
jgi:hypothetical protein